MQHKVITAGALNFKMATSHLINVCEDVIIAGALNLYLRPNTRDKLRDRNTNKTSHQMLA